jgi:tRNA threonylcarbamoyladenosine biosynthesis protein TsaE
MEYRVTSIDELAGVAQTLLSSIVADTGHATVIGLSGDLGSGKTTFTKSLAATLGVSGDILSPTFVIAKFYPLKGQLWRELVHIDAYRIEKEEELTPLRFTEMFDDPTKLVIIEWPERLGNNFPKFASTLNFLFIDEATRMITTP